MAVQLHTRNHLMEKEKEARLAVQAKTSFMASMSHEIRNPLFSMIGFLQITLSEGTELSTEHREW